MLLTETDKFCPRVVPVVHLGYSSVYKGYVLYEFSYQLFFICRDTVFREDIFHFKHLHTFPSHLFPVLELRDVECPTLHDLRSLNSLSPSSTPYPSLPPLSDQPSPFLSSTSSLSTTDHSSSPPLLSPANPGLRRSSRLTKPPIWMEVYVVSTKTSFCTHPISYCVTYDNLSPAYRVSLAAYSAIIEPRSYDEAKADSKWIEAMEAEISALEANQTWTIVDIPQGKTPIWYKWVFKVKYKSTSEVER